MTWRRVGDVLWGVLRWMVVDGRVVVARVQRVEDRLMGVDERLTAVADAIDAFKTEATASIENLQADIANLTAQVGADQPKEATIERLESLATGLSGLKDSLATLAAETPDAEAPPEGDGTGSASPDEPPPSDGSGDVGGGAAPSDGQ